MTVLYVVTVEVAPDRADEWNRWHSEVHVPEVLREKGFLACRKYRDQAKAEDGWVRFQVHFDLADLSAYEAYDQSAAAAHLRKDAQERFQGAARYRRAVLTRIEPA